MTGKSGPVPLFETDGLGRVYDDGTKALGSLSMTARPGDFVSLVGPSGCGKSTFLRILAGLDSATAGELFWRLGAPGRGDIGFVFQEPTLLPWATVWDNVYLPLRIAERTREAVGANVAAAIGLVGLTGFEQHFPRQLSGGMKMRVSVARALVTRPRLLLMDEPFAALDEITRFRLNDDLLAVWADQGCTVVFVTHSVFEAVYLSQRVLVMSARPGRVLAEIDIPLPYPRTPELRTDEAYARLCRTVSEQLMEGHR